MKLSKLKINPNNPQKFNDLSKLENSIKEFPKMMQLRPLVYDPETMQVLGGNKRLICLQNLGHKEIPDTWVMSANELTEEEKHRFIIADNVGFGQWDWDILANEWDSAELNEWGLDVWQLYTNTDVNMVNSGDENDEWVGMPEFESKESPLKIVISFQTEKDREEFAELHKLQFIKKQQNAWMSRYPYDGRDDLNSLKYK